MGHHNAVSVDQSALVDTTALLHLIPVDRCTIWRWMQAGKFPQVHKKFNKRNYWRRAAVLEWLNAAE